MREVNIFKLEQQTINGCRQSVKVLDKVALFHAFAQEADGEGQSNPVAIVECADGQVETVYAHMIAFVEGPKGADAPTALRDEFASMAMEGVLSTPMGAEDFTFEERAEWCYMQADAMLAERAKP